MRITKGPSSFTLKASWVDFLFGRTIPAARWVRFERVWGRVTVRPRLLSGSEQRIDYSQIRKVHHRISAPLVRTELDDGRFAFYRSASSSSEIVLELRDGTRVPVYIEIFEQGGDTRGVRERIRQTQRIADEISRIVEKPQVIEFQEVECAFDLGDRKVRFLDEMLPREIRGTSLAFRQIDRIEVTETPRGFYSVTFFPRWGRQIETTRGVDATNFLSDTVTMIADRSNLVCLRSDRVRRPAESEGTSPSAIRPRLLGSADPARAGKGAFFPILDRIRRRGKGLSLPGPGVRGPL